MIEFQRDFNAGVIENRSRERNQLLLLLFQEREVIDFFASEKHGVSKFDPCGLKVYRNKKDIKRKSVKERKGIR